MSTEVRSAHADDIDRICDIIGEALDPEDAAEARLVLEDDRFDGDRWLVGVADGKVESTLALFDGDLRIGEAILPAGQIEFVATSEAARGRGLIAAQMAEAHRRSGAAGHLAQFIVGIPNFYRQFGYSYAVRQPPYQEVPADFALSLVAGWDMRSASSTDIPTIEAAQRTIQDEAAVALTHSTQLWQWLIDSPNYEVVTGTHKGQVAVGRIYDDGDTAYLGDVVAPTRGALHALIAHARATQPEVTVMHRPASLLTSMLSAIGAPNDELGWYYVRIDSIRAFLDGIRPELAARLARSSLAGFSGRLTLSQYRNSVTCGFENGLPSEFEDGGAVPYPVSAGASGVPQDLFPDLVLGPHGGSALAGLHGDVLLGEQRDLIEVLFPPVTADIQTWVFP